MGYFWSGFYFFFNRYFKASQPSAPLYIGFHVGKASRLKAWIQVPLFRCRLRVERSKGVLELRVERAQGLCVCVLFKKVLKFQDISTNIGFRKEDTRRGTLCFNHFFRLATIFESPLFKR